MFNTRFFIAPRVLLFVNFKTCRHGYTRVMGIGGGRGRVVVPRTESKVRWGVITSTYEWRGRIQLRKAPTQKKDQGWEDSGKTKYTDDGNNGRTL